jgi:hypothetical protein
MPIGHTRARRYLLAGIVIVAIADWAYPWLLWGALQWLPLSRLLPLSPQQARFLGTQSVKASLYASLVLLPFTAGILLGTTLRNRFLKLILSLVLGWSAFALSLWGVGMIYEGNGAPRKEHGLYRLATDERGTTYAFSPGGPTFHVPLHWSPTDPYPQQAAHLVRDDSDEATARCWFSIFNDRRYRGLSGGQILERFHNPRTFREMADTASLVAFDKPTLDGLPAYRSSWSSVATHRGIQVPLRTRLVSVAYKEFVISSGCVATNFDSRLLAKELDDIQMSFRGTRAR